MVPTLMGLYFQDWLNIALVAKIEDLKEMDLINLKFNYPFAEVPSPLSKDEQIERVRLMRFKLEQYLLSINIEAAQ